MKKKKNENTEIILYILILNDESSKNLTWTKKNCKNLNKLIII